MTVTRATLRKRLVVVERESDSEESSEEEGDEEEVVNEEEEDEAEFEDDDYEDEEEEKEEEKEEEIEEEKEEKGEKRKKKGRISISLKGQKVCKVCLLEILFFLANAVSIIFFQAVEGVVAFILIRCYGPPSQASLEICTSVNACLEFCRILHIACEPCS